MNHRASRLVPVALLAALLVMAAHAAIAPPAWGAGRSATATRKAAGERVPLDVAHRAAAERLIGAALASDRAFTRLSELCDGIGHRLSGSAPLERAVEWAAASMRADGLDRVWLQPVMVPHWERGAERATMTRPGPQSLSILTLGRSIGTPPGGIEADVVVVGSFAELEALPDSAVRGRIVLWDVPFTNYSETVRYRSSGVHRAARRGAVASMVRSVGPVSLRTPHTGSMAAYTDTVPHIPAVAVSIEDATMMRRLRARGERVTVRLELGARTLPDARSHNVIGEIRGRERPDEVVVIGGHLDSWDVGQGAHDDGGGCVISMEALRLIKQLGLKPRRTLRCVLWTNEENGTAGAKAYADSSHGAPSSHFAAVETDGGVERVQGFDYGAFLLGTEKVDSTRAALAMRRGREIARLMSGLGADRVRDGGGGADIEPLMKLGVPGIAHRTTMEHYFDWHHTPSDMLDKVDPIELRKNVAAMAVVVWVLAEMDEPLAGPNPTPAPGASTTGTR